MSAKVSKLRIGILGCGQMGSSIAVQLGAAHNLYLYDRNDDKAKAVSEESNGEAVKSCEELFKKSDIILLAIKPQDISSVAVDTRGFLKHSHIIVSILAGTTLVTLKHYFGKAVLLRMMPNLALKYGKGVLGLCGNAITPEIKQKIELLCSPLGMPCWLPEDKMDALTALTASGPAFFFVMVEAMVDAAISMGFPAAQALQLVLQMISGSVTLLTETKKHPGELKWQVSSPAGTTIEGLNMLEAEGVRSGIIQTFLAAYHRSKQMAQHQ